LNGKYSNTTYIHLLKFDQSKKKQIFNENPHNPRYNRKHPDLVKKNFSSGNAAGNPALKGTTSRIYTFDLNNPGKSKVTTKTSCADHKSHCYATMDSTFDPIAAAELCRLPTNECGKSALRDR